MNNDTYFTKNGMKLLQRNRYEESAVDLTASKWHDVLPTVTQLHQETNTKPPTIEVQNDTQKCKNIHESIKKSKDKILFIKFLPAGMMRPKWYAVQIDIESTKEANPEYLKNSQYWCVFLMKHPQDANKSDEYARWWPDWYRYTTDKATGQIIYGQRVLIRPNVTPSKRTHVQWAELVDLSDSTNTILVEPFDFNSTETSTRNTIAESKWKQLKKLCEEHSLIPPTLGSNQSVKINARNLIRKTRKRKKEN
jgi:hypothetical protein